MYSNVELLVRQLKNKFRSSRMEGELRPFYTIAELMDKIRRAGCWCEGFYGTTQPHARGLYL